MNPYTPIHKLSGPAQAKPHPGMEALRAAKFREFGILTEELQGRFLLTRHTRNWIVAAGTGYPDIQCRPEGYMHDTQDPDEIRASIQAHADLLEDIYQARLCPEPLSAELLKTWHGRITGPQNGQIQRLDNDRFQRIPLIKGDWKIRGNYKIIPGRGRIEFCEPDQVEAEIAAFVAEDQKHQSRPPIERAAWQLRTLHHIHPFQDGNTRTSFMLAARTLICAGLPPIIPDPADPAEYHEWHNAMDQDDLTAITQAANTLLNTACQRWGEAEGRLRWHQNAILLGSGGISPDGQCIRPSQVRGRTIATETEKAQEDLQVWRIKMDAPFSPPKTPEEWREAIHGEPPLPEGCIIY